MIALAVIATALLAVWAILMLNLPARLANNKRSSSYIACIVIALLLTAAVVGWMQTADSALMGQKELVGHYLIDNEFSGEIYQDTNGQYFILEMNMLNVVHPEKRMYLDYNAATEYLNATSMINASYIKSLVVEVP